MIDLKPEHFVGANIMPVPNDGGTMAGNILQVVSQMRTRPAEPDPHRQMPKEIK
jgi:hypothetical protein